MENPFTNGQIKNYLLFYASILIIMILFFIATSLFHDVKEVEKKNFIENNSSKKEIKVEEQKIIKNEKMKFKLMDADCY